jgi:oligopeptide/dipeptide ABC transporter ATP-binding protein
MPLLEVIDLHKTFGHGAHTVPAVRGVTLSIERGETLGLVGESGCGKTTLGRMVVGLLDPSSGTIRFNEEPVDGKFSEVRLRRRVQMVFQHPAQSLNPRLRVEQMLAEPLRLLTDIRHRHIAAKIDETLRLVGLDSDYARRRPRQLSGGQQQRVAIARALICDPDLVVLDEPTSSLDQSVRGRIVALLREIQRERGVAFVFISHDLSTVQRIAHRVAVMYLGRVVELAGTETVFRAARHPYTDALLSAVPQMDVRRKRERIILPGETPNPSALPVGCSFQDRCPLVHDRCRREAPQLLPAANAHLVECLAVAAEVSHAG